MQAVLPNPAFLSFCTVRTQGISVYFTVTADLGNICAYGAMMLALKRK